MEYYSIPTRFTEITGQTWMIPLLRNDMDFLFRCVKSILLHPFDAKKEGVKFDRSNSKLFHATHTTVDSILAFPGLCKSLKCKSLPLKTLAADKAVLSCDHHALLFASFARYAGKSIRVKPGFALYFVPETYVPHWIVEVYDQREKRWTLVDPDRCLTFVEREKFLCAHRAWSDHFNKGIAFPSFSGFPGLQGLKYALICELNCLFKNELLGYEWRVKKFNTSKPEIVKTSYERLASSQREDLHEIAALMANPDSNMVALTDFYQKYGLGPLH